MLCVMREKSLHIVLSYDYNDSSLYSTNISTQFSGLYVLIRFASDSISKPCVEAQTWEIAAGPTIGHIGELQTGGR